jgi:2'-5' RNA ligase
MRFTTPDEDEWGDDDEAWRGQPTIFLIVEVRGSLGTAIADIQRRYDPKLAARSAPHLTLTGSSGLGPLPASLSREDLRRALQPIVASTAPFVVSLGRAERFMQTNIIVLPIDPHGPIRELHDRVARSGLPFAPAKFTFTPHVTLNYFATPGAEHVKSLLNVRVDEPMVIDHIQCSLAHEPERPSVLLELPFSAA